MNERSVDSPFAALLEKGGLSLTPALQKAGVLLCVAPKQDVFLEGEPASEFFMIAAGRVKLWRTQDDGSACTLLLLGEGESLGSVAIAKNGTQLTSATAMDHVTLVAWNAALFRAELRHSVDFGASFMRVVADRAHQLLERFSDLTAPTVEERLARTLVRLIAEFGQYDEPGTVNIEVRQQDLAEMALTTVPTVSRCFSRWEREAVLIGARGIVKVRDVHRLAAAAGVHLD